MAEKKKVSSIRNDLLKVWTSAQFKKAVPGPYDFKAIVSTLRRLVVLRIKYFNFNLGNASVTENAIHDVIKNSKT